VPCVEEKRIEESTAPGPEVLGTARAPNTAQRQSKGDHDVNWDRIEGNWKQLKGKLKQRWGELTDDDLDRIAGKKDELVGKLQERKGIAREEAEREVQEWSRGLEP
jgi:uncharacterized protein YjbJ (UPF0337 family)